VQNGGDITDKDLFGQYVEQHGRELTRMCFHLCANRQDAEDLYQETWLRAIRYYRRYNSEKPFKHWLHAICVNTYKNGFKSSNIKAVDFKTQEDKDRFLNEVKAPADFSDEYFDLAAAVNALTNKHRVVIVLKYFSDYTENNIAEMLKIPVGTVKSRLYKARERLKIKLS